MKKSFNPAYLPYIALFCGCFGLLLRCWLFLTGIDDKGLIISDHPATWLVWLLTVITVIILIVGTSRLLEAAKYSFNFPASIPGGIGTFLAVAGILVCTVTEAFSKPDTFGVLVCVLGALSVPALCFVGYCRCKGAHPSVIFHVTTSVYLLLRLVWMYRQWSSDPQLHSYVFQLLALTCLMLACYHRCAFDADMGIRRSYVIFNLAAVYFCFVSIPGCDNLLFYLTSGIWMLTDLCSLLPMKTITSEEG